MKLSGYSWKTKAVAYATAYLLASVGVYSLMRWLGPPDNLAYANLSAFWFGFVFAAYWAPNLGAILLSAVMFSVLFVVDTHGGFFWLSGPKSAESYWLIPLAGIGWVIPLGITWLGRLLWRKAARLGGA